MLTSSERKDYILRMIEEIRRMLQHLVEKVREGDAAGALGETQAAIGKLLGPVAGIAPRMDSVTAAQMVNDADVLGAWAAVLEGEASVHREAGDDPAASAAARRALEIALEAHLRTVTDQPELLEMIGRLRAAVDPSTLDPRHRDALAELRPTSVDRP